MGGGSSNAAATLLMMNKAWGLNLSNQQLLEIASELGSDVPFFLHSQPAICRGRGERIELIGGLPKLHFVIVKPPIGFSTAEVFSRFKTTPDRDFRSVHQACDVVNSLRQGRLGSASKWMRNSLEPAAEAVSNWISRLRETFARCGCWAHAMTGSGSAYFGIARNAFHARRVSRLLMGEGLGAVLVTSSC